MQWIHKKFSLLHKITTSNFKKFLKTVKLYGKKLSWTKNELFRLIQTIAALKDLDFEIDLPDSRPTFKENLDSFRKLWMSLDYDIELLYQNLENHQTNQEYCCLDCHFPFATACSELYSKFDPDPP